MKESVAKVNQLLDELISEVNEEEASFLAFDELLYLIKEVQRIETSLSAHQLCLRLRQAAKEEPASPPLVALVLSQRGLSPLRKEADEPPSWWKESGRLAEDVRGPFDQETGLPIFVERTKDEAEMVLIPAGEFIYGSDQSQWESPQRKERTGYYYIDRYQVAVSSFMAFLKATKRKYEEPRRNLYGQEAMRFVSLHDVRAYAAWARASVPTELQWEKAARGTDGRTYPWGEDNLAWRYANYFYNEGQGDRYAFLDCQVSASGKHRDGQSPFGLFDMAGNVWEWCGNPFAGENSEEPYFAIRGGSCIEWATGLRCSYRHEDQAKPAGFRDEYLGFRLVVPLEEL